MTEIVQLSSSLSLLSSHNQQDYQLQYWYILIALLQFIPFISVMQSIQSQSQPYLSLQHQTICYSFIPPYFMKHCQNYGQNQLCNSNVPRYWSSIHNTRITMALILLYPSNTVIVIIFCTWLQCMNLGHHHTKIMIICNSSEVVGAISDGFRLFLPAINWTIAIIHSSSLSLRVK